MAKIIVADGAKSDMDASSGGAALLPPGMYFGSVVAVKREKYSTSSGTMLKDVYTWNIITDQGNVEMITDLTIGNVNEAGQLYRPDGKNDKSAVWGGARKKHDAATGKDVWVITTIQNPIIALGVPTFTEYDNELMVGRVAYIEIAHEPFTMRAREEGGEQTNHYKNAIGRIYAPNAEEVAAQDLPFVQVDGVWFVSAQAAEDFEELAALEDNRDNL